MMPVTQRGAAGSVTSSTLGATREARRAAPPGNEALLSQPVDHGSDDDAMAIMYMLNAQQGVGDRALQRGAVRTQAQERQRAIKQMEQQQAKEAKEAKKKEHHGGFFKGISNLVSHVVSNVVHVRVADLVRDIRKDLGTTLDVKNPQFWRDMGTIAKLYGKAVAVCAAAAATVATGGAFAVAMCVAVVVAMAISAAMQEGQLGNKLGMSQKLQMAIGFTATAIAIVGTVGIGVAGSGSAVATQAKTAIDAAKGAAQAAKVLSQVGSGLNAAGNTAGAVSTVMEAKYEAHLDLLHASTIEAQNRAQQANTDLQRGIEQLGDVTQVYEKSQSVLVDAIGMEDRTQQAIVGGIRA